jgi:hypothetical protein
MKSKGLVSLSHGFVIGILCLLVWTAIGASISHFLAGEAGKGALFLAVGAAISILFARAGVLKRFGGRRVPVSSLYIAAAALILIGGVVASSLIPLRPPFLTEAYGSIRSALLMNYLDRVVFSGGYLLFIVFMLWQVIVSLRSRE